MFRNLVLKNFPATLTLQNEMLIRAILLSPSPSRICRTSIEASNWHGLMQSLARGGIIKKEEKWPARR